MFKKYMCLALCLLMALGTMSTTASAASSADALVASYVSFSDSTGVISDLPESESTVTASVTVSNNSSRASSVVLWVGKFVDDVLTDVTYQQQEVAGNAQDVTISASLDGVKKDLATAADGSSYDRTVLKAFVWTALVGGKALAPVASLPSDNLDVVAVKKDGDVWKDFNSATTNYDLTITKTDPIPEFEFIVADNSTKVEMPDAFVIGSNTVKLTSAAGTEKEYTINLIDGFTNDGIFFDDFQSYNGVMDAHIWTNASGYLKNMTLVEEDDGNAYVSIFGTADQQWPRLDTVVTGLDLGNVIEISGKAMLQNSASNNPTMTVQFRRSLQAQVSVLGISDSSVSLFGQSFGGGVEMNTWFDFKLSVTYDEGTKNATVTATVTGDGVNGETLTSTRTGSLSSLNLNNDLPLMFNTGLDKEGTSSVNLDDIKVAYGPSADTTLQTLQYSAEGVTYDVADFVPGAPAPADGYRIYVPVGTTSVTLKGVPTIAQGAKAEVYVDGVLSADNSVAVAGQETAATVRVTAEDGTTTADYPITIVIGDAVASTNIKLASLTYTIDGEEPATVSGFTPADEGGSYNVILPNGTTSVTLSATPANANATYTMALADGTPVENGVVDVTNGATVVITVTPEDTGAAKGVFTINFAIDQGMYVLDENNGAVQSENSGIEFTTAVLESGSATYDYADGFVIGGVGSSGNRNSDYVLNGDGKNLGYTWTLSSDEYMPGTYNVYVKGSGYGSNSKDSFYFVYDEAACSPDSGLVFKAPSQANAPIAEQDMVALNWVAGDNTITIPEDGSATLRILGREGDAFVDKVILIDMNVAKTIEEAEAEMSPLYDAVFTSEGGDTLATVKYGSDVVGTAVPTEGTYLDEDSIPATGTIDALVVPEKEGFAGSWSPAVLQDGGTTFVPVYEEPVDLIFEDDFEGYGELTVPDNSKWDGVYRYNTELRKDGSNTYASLFPAIREDVTPPSFERYPRLSESFAFDATKGALRFSGRVMLQDNIAKTEFGLHLLGTGNSRGYPMSLSASQIKVFGVEESFGQMPTGNWVDFTYYLTYDSNSKNAEGLMILEGEGLTDAFGNTTNRIVAAGATDLSAVGISDKLTMYLNTSFSAEDSGASVNLDNIKVGYASVPALSDNATLSSLTYAVDGGTAETVPGFTANAEPNADGYSITLPEGTTSVTIDGAVADASATGSVLINGVASEDGTIAVQDGSNVTAVYRVIAENGKMNQYVVNITVEGVMQDHVTNLTTAAAAGAYTENGGYTTEQVPSISGKYAVTDGLIPGTTSRYTSESAINPRAVSANTSSYFNGATVIRGDRNDRTASPGGNWSTRPYYVGTSGNPDAYNGKDDNGYWLEFTVTSACTVFQTLTGPVDTNGVWPNAPADWTKNTKSNFVLDGSSNFYYKHYEAGETVRIPNFGKIDTWKDINWKPENERTAWYEAPTWFIVWDSTGKVNPAESSDVAKLSSLQYTVAGGVATDVPGFDAAAESGAYNLTLGEGTTSVTITAAAQENGTATIMVGDEEVVDGVIDLTSGLATVKVVVSSESGLVSNAFTINITVEGADIVNQILNLTEAEPNASVDLQMKADTIVFGTTSPYLLYSVGEANNSDGTNAGAAIYGASNAPEFFEGATAIRRNKGDAFGSNNTEASTAKYWGNPAYSGKDDNGYYLTFEVSSDATVYVVDREGKGWPNKPDGWQTSKYKYGSATMFYKTFKAGETVQIPNYGWDNSWTTLTSDRAFKDPSYYVVVWGECPETSEPEPEENAKLSALTYTVGDQTLTVPGFSATDEGGDYAAIELPYGTTEVTVGATRADDNASVTISPENPIAVSSAAETVVTVTVTNGNTTNTFKLTFTVAAQEPQPTEEIFSDDFEAYGLDTALDKATKGWDAVNQTANFTAVTNPDGSGQVAEVKSWGKEFYPSLRKNVPMQAGETYAISGKARVHDGEQKPNHYLEFRSSRPNPDYDPSDENSSQTITATATTFSVSSSVISLPEGNVIGYMPSEEAWISYTLYITPSATGVELVAEVTGEGLKDANGNDTDKIVAGKTLNTQELVPSAGDRTVTVIFNNRMGAESDARIYLDDLVIREGATAPTLSSDTNLSSLKYAPNGSNATDVPGFAEDKTDYGTIELPKGTTSVTVTAVTKDANARASVKVGEDVMAGGVVTVSPDAATDVVVVVTAQDGTTKNITMSFTVADEEEPEPTEIISNLTYATSDTPVLAQIERGVTESYTNADGCVITTASSAEFEGAYVLQRNKGGDTTGPNWEAEPNYIGAFDGQNGNPYWMTFTMNVAGTVYVVDMEGKGWPNRGDWLVDTTGLTFGIWEMTINGSSGRLFSKHFNAGDTVYMPNYGWKDEWKDETVKDGRVFTNPSIYLIVPDSDLTKSASLKSLTYTVGDGSAVTVPDFVSGSTETNTFDVTIADMSAAVKVAAEGITNANASISYSSNVAADGTVTFEGNTAQVVVTVKSADESVTNTYTINFTRNVDPMAGAKTYDVPSHDGTTIDILVNPELTALRSNSGNNEIKPTEPIGNLSKFYGDRNDTGTDGKTPGMAFTDVGAAIMGATQLINPIGDTPGRAKDEDLKAFTGADNEYFRFRANEAGTVYVKFDSDIASYEADPSWTKVVEPSTGLAGMGDWGANGLPDEYVHNYEQYPYYCNMYQNASSDAKPTNYATRYTVTYYKTFAADEIVTIRTINSTNNQNLITLIQWGEDVPSYNVALKSLTYNGISVPNFSADTKDYTIYMPTADAVSIAAVAADSGVDVSYTKQSLTPSAEGDTATITVSNGEGTQTVYTVKAILDATPNKVLNLSSASRADVQENLVIGASDGTGGSLAYIDREDVFYNADTSTFFEGATYIRPAKDDGNAVYSTKPYFSETYNGKDGNPYWLEFVVTSDCRIFFADTYYNADLTYPDLGMQDFAQPWPNKPEGWIIAEPTDDVDIVSTNFQARTENGSVYYKDFKAGDVVQIPNYGAPSYWADDRAPYDPPVYLIVWGSDIQNPGIDDGGDIGGGDSGDEGGIEDGGQQQ